MNVRIYQINMKRDTNNVAFMNYESLPKFQGSSEIDSSLYDKVFEGEVNCFTLEKLYEIFNLEHPAGYKGRSMSVSDVVEIIDGNTGKSYFHFCDSFGFQQISFKPEKTQISDRFLSLAEQEKISVLLIPVGKSPVVKEIPNTYEAMKELVGGGGLDEYMPFEDDAAIICNRDGKQEKLPMNRAVYKEVGEVADIIHGDFFIARSNVADEKYSSLSGEQLLKYKRLFRYPERFHETAHGIEIEPFKPDRADKER